MDITRKYLWAAVYTAVLLCFTLYVVLDTFVITREYDTSANKINFVKPTSAVSEPAAVSEATGSPTITVVIPDNTEITENTQNTVTAAATSPAEDSAINVSGGTLSGSYSDENISISLYTFREYDTQIYVADVILSSAEYLKSAFANDTYGRNVTDTTSSIAADHGAVFAVNGDYYGSQSRGYVLRNGVSYRESVSGREDLVIYPDGSFEIINERKTSLSEVAAKNAWQVLSFGPALVADGEISVTKDQEVGKAMASNPRTAIGIAGDLHYVFVVSDGRTDESEGLSLYQLAGFMQRLGVNIAYNLDGGGSSAMYFNGEIINKPTTNGRIKERSISDIVYVGY